LEQGTLDIVRTSVVVADTEEEQADTLLRLLEAYDPRGSSARIDWAAPGLAEEDWTPLFRGVLEDWRGDGLTTRLILKTDDTLFRTQIPRETFLRPVWPTASDSTVFGTTLPLAMGIFDAFAITARGMVPCVNIRYDENLGYWWAVSANNQKTIRRIYFDGVSQPDSIWTTRRGVWGGSVLTIVEVTAGSQPEKGVVVSCDLEGPDSSGLYAGASVTNPVRQLRTIIEEFAYREPPIGAYRGDHVIIDDASWDAAETWFDARGYESARRWGADQNAETAADVVQSFLDDHPFVRIDWTPGGTLQFIIFDPDDVDPDDAAHFAVREFNEGGQAILEPVDEKEVYTHVRVPFMWSPAEGKFLSALEAHDVAALDVKVPTEIPNRWSQGRFSQA
jgi:hypothetical protein